MKTYPIILLLILSYSYSFCQKQADSTSAHLKNKVAAINAYINEVNKNPNLYPVIRPIPDFGIYRETKYYNRMVPYSIPKIVQVTQNVKTSYIKNNKTVYTSEISSAHGNYSKIKNVYWENNTIIYSYEQLCEEHVLQIQYSYDGARAGGSYTLTIKKDSIKLYEGGEISIANSPSNWNKLLALLNLADFDKIRTTGFRSYIDGTDWSYVITTDKRTHSFVNSSPSDPEMIKMTKFFEQINLLMPMQKK